MRKQNESYVTRVGRALKLRCVMLVQQLHPRKWRDRRGTYVMRHRDEIARVVRGDASAETLRRLAFERSSLAMPTMKARGSTVRPRFGAAQVW